MPNVEIRLGGPSDFGPALSLWWAAETARRDGREAAPEYRDRVSAHLGDPESFLLVADTPRSEMVGMAVGSQGLSDDGSGPPIPGMCHIAAVFVAPGHWGLGIGGGMVDAILSEARSRGYDRAQLWTHANNSRAQRLYESRGFAHTGRRKEVDSGEPIIHYQCTLGEGWANDGGLD